MSNWEKVPHDYTGVGVNPMYQSSGTIATQDSSQYDEIKTTPRRIVHQPPERVTTSNSLYASAGEVTMKHPILGGTDGQLSNVSPEFMINDNKEIRTCSYCSPDAAILTCSLLVILLSIIAITLAMLLLFGVVGASDSSSSLTTTVTSSNSSSLSGGNSESNCSCSINNATLSFILRNFTAINDSISLITQEIMKLRQSENMSVSDTLQQLYYYKYQINAINDSLQQLLNQPRQFVLSGLNLTSSISINHGDCVNIHRSCQITVDLNSFFFDIQNCQTPTVNYTNGSHIIVSVSGSVSPSNNIATQQLTNATTVAYRVQTSGNETNDTTIDKLMKSEVFILCYSFNSVPARCDFYATLCPYQRNNVTSILSIHE